LIFSSYEYIQKLVEKQEQNHPVHPVKHRAMLKNQMNRFYFLKKIFYILINVFNYINKYYLFIYNKLITYLIYLPDPVLVTLLLSFSLFFVSLFSLLFEFVFTVLLVIE